MARKFAEKNILRPISVIWCHHIISRNRESSQQLWKEYVQNSSQIDYQPIAKKASNDNDADLIKDLITCLESTETGKVYLDGAYSCLLSIYVRQNQFDEAVQIFELLRSNGKLIKGQVLIKLKAGLEATGKKFPY